MKFGHIPYSLIHSISLLLLLGGSCPTVAEPPRVPLKLEDIIQAGQRRQERVKSLHFVWSQRVTDAKGSRTLPKSIDPSGTVIPPRDTTYDMRPELYIDGEKMRYTHEDPQWSKTEQTFISCGYTASFDGELLKILFDKAAPDKLYPSGSIRAAKKHFSVGEIHLRPLLMTFRAADPKMRPLDLSQMELSGRLMRIQGHTCSEMQLQQPASTGVSQLWVDPSRHFVIPRYVVTNKGKVIYQIDVDFIEDAQAGWVPSSWKVVANLPSGEMRSSARSKIIKYEINPAIPANHFDIAFPLGAHMENFVTGETYIIKKDGSKRQIERAELGLTYEQLDSSRPGELVGQSPSFFEGWGVWLLGAILGGSMLAFVWLCYRRFRLRRAGTSQVG